MYSYEWTNRNGIYKLSISSKIEKEIRPVFKDELDYFGFNQYWKYKNTDAPLLWAEGIRRYILNGECVAEALGGGFYTKPKIIINKKKLTLKPIDVEDLWQTNERLLRGLEKTATEFIRRAYENYSQKGMEFVVAFSGGKDSLALLELASLALSPDKFFVVFSDTGMELSTTYQAIEKAKERWKSLRFFKARSHLTPSESWDLFGPPGRRMRWCCTVHKSTPTILLLRYLTGNYDVKAVVFDGVRSEESAARAKRGEISEGTKNINQVNCSPIYNWNTAELYAYLLHKKLLINDAYKKGLFRVGCSVCPMSSSWWESLTNDLYHDEIVPLLTKVEKYAELSKSDRERKKFVEEGGWRGRMGGRDLINGGNRITETIEDEQITFSIFPKTQRWLDVCPILGPIVSKQNNTYTQLIGNQQVRFRLSGKDENVITYSPFSRIDRFALSKLRGIANKVGYCIGCKACEVQCPVGAFNVGDDGLIFIRKTQCIHCGNCIEFTNGKGCLVAKSLSITGGGNSMDLKGMNRYQHFGLRRAWLEHFFETDGKCFSKRVEDDKKEDNNGSNTRFDVDESEESHIDNRLGNRQYDSLKVWVKEAELLSISGKGANSGVPTELFTKLQPLGAGHPIVWAVIWTNLVYNSIICKWYALNCPPGKIYEKNELVYMLGDDYSKSTRDNSITSLFEIFRYSPIGAVLKQGIPISIKNTYKFSKAGWNKPDAVAILYSLYKWAEATGRYTFTLSQLDDIRGNFEVPGVDPVAIFGIDPVQFKDILQDIALHYEKFIRVAFVADLDNITLFPEIKSLNVLDLINTMKNSER